MLDAGQHVVLTEAGRRGSAVISGGLLSPLRLTDGRFLRITHSVFHDTGDDRPGVLKSSQSSYQYQADAAGEDWIFRYDYLREPRDQHPTAHLQVRAVLAADARPYRGSLEHVHFPTGRPTLEAVIRCLIEQFEVPANSPPELWRPALAETERVFLDHARHPLSGPS